MTDPQRDLVVLLQSAVDQCRFHVLRDKPVAAATVRAMYQQGVEGLVGWRDYNLAITIDDNNPALTTFVEALRVSVNDCLDESGRIGDGLVALMGGGEVYPHIEQYATGLLLPGASLGAGPVVDILYGWIRGEPVRYKRLFALANGLTGDPTSTIDVADGVQVSALPTSSQALYRRFPSLHGMIDATELMGKVLLSIVCVSDVPGIFKPGFEATTREHTVAPEFHQDRFCEAVSLAENKNVSWQFAPGSPPEPGPAFPCPCLHDDPAVLALRRSPGRGPSARRAAHLRLSWSGE